MPSSVLSEFDKILWVCHLNAIKIVCQEITELETIAARISISLLRYADLLPADKTFYEAGVKAKVISHFLKKNIYQISFTLYLFFSSEYGLGQFSFCTSKSLFGHCRHG